MTHHENVSCYIYVPFWFDREPFPCTLELGSPDYSSSEEAESKSLSMDVMGTYMKVINPPYNHDPKSIGLGANWKTNFYPFFDATS